MDDGNASPIGGAFYYVPDTTGTYNLVGTIQRDINVFSTGEAFGSAVAVSNNQD
jgi:hypothetical protein